MPVVRDRTRHARVSFPDFSPFSADLFGHLGPFFAYQVRWTTRTALLSLPACSLSFPRYTTFAMASTFLSFLAYKRYTLYRIAHELRNEIIEELISE